MNNNKNLGTVLIPIITLIIAVIALVPAFLSLNDKEAMIYYQIEFSKINIPKSINENKALELLKDNGIPNNTLEVKIINQGNASAKKIKISISLPEEPMVVWSQPSRNDNPIWVDIPQFDTLKTTNSNLELKNMATTIPLSIFVGYSNIIDSKVDIQIFHDGIPAIKVDDISSIQKWSKWSVFILPGYILLAGLILTIIWSFIVVLYKNPEFRKSLLNGLLDISYQVSGVGFTLKEAIETIDKANAIKENQTKKP